jgi:hypothetical protein
VELTETDDQGKKGERQRGNVTQMAFQIFTTGTHIYIHGEIKMKDEMSEI